MLTSTTFASVGRTYTYSKGSADGWVVRGTLSSITGTISSVVEYRYGGASLDQFYDVAYSKSGYGMAVGSTSSSGAGGYDGWMVEFNYSSGAASLAKTIGGTKYEYIYGLAKSTYGTWLTAGRSSSYGNGTYDTWQLSTSATGGTMCLLIK